VAIPAKNTFYRRYEVNKKALQNWRALKKSYREKKGVEDECFLLLFLYLKVSKERHLYACSTTTDTVQRVFRAI
jgi:hypothetical protein